MHSIYSRFVWNRAEYSRIKYTFKLLATSHVTPSTDTHAYQSSSLKAKTPTALNSSRTISCWMCKLEKWEKEAAAGHAHSIGARTLTNAKERVWARWARPRLCLMAIKCCYRKNVVRKSTILKSDARMCVDLKKRGKQGNKINNHNW